MVAVRVTQMQSFMGLMRMVIMPMFFLSGALFPVTNLPGWLAFLNRIDPLTCAVSPMRSLVFTHLNLSEEAEKALNPGITWFGWTVPVALEVATVAVLGPIMLLGVQRGGVGKGPGPRLSAALVLLLRLFLDEDLDLVVVRDGRLTGTRDGEPDVDRQLAEPGQELHPRRGQLHLHRPRLASFSL